MRRWPHSGRWTRHDRRTAPAILAHVITPRKLRFTIALLLPLMVLRAMLPVGYMPVARDGTLRIAMCSDGLFPDATIQDREQPAGIPGDHNLPAGSSDCVFAHAAVTAPPPAVSQSLVMVEFDAGAAPATTAQIRPASPARVQSARGTPSLSL